MAMNDTWQKVNRDFGSIFSTLLPGTAAKLEPPEGGTFLDGERPALAIDENLAVQPTVPHYMYENTRNTYTGIYIIPPRYITLIYENLAVWCSIAYAVRRADALVVVAVEGSACKFVWLGRCLWWLHFLCVSTGNCSQARAT